MRIRKLKNNDEIIENSNYTITNPKDYINKYQALFNNDNPIHLEIGSGKGDFIINNALTYPNINFIGIEKFTTVAARILSKLENKEIPNLKIIIMDAEEVNEIFNHEIDTLYLNFSDPWPKTRHEKRRLTSDIFLNVYDDIFIGNPTIIQKTDNQGLIESSIVSFSNYGYKIKEISLDLAKTEIPNIETEYERKFKQLNQNIYYLKVEKEQKK